MNLFGFWKRQELAAPAAVIQAACNFYGIAPECAPTVHVEKLDALADNIWVVKLNETASAVVAYVPEEKEQTVTAPWFGE